METRKMGRAAVEIVRQHFFQSRDVLTQACESVEFANMLISIGEAIVFSLKNGGKVLLAGNGGSAADAQHIAGELVSRLNYDRAPLAAIALTTDSSVLTAVGNDYGYERVFERQIRGLARVNDVFVAISTSGMSPNILCALAVAREMGVTTIGFTGLGGRMAEHCNLLLRAPSAQTPQIQQIHIIAAHAVCDLVEQAMFPRSL